MSEVLDNPVWHALTAGPHSAMAIGSGLARHYPRDIAPFSAIAEPSASAYAELAHHLPAGLEARLFRAAEEEPAPAGWVTLSARPILQLVADRPDVFEETELSSAALAWVDLGAADVTSMMALAEAAEPGPFGARTVLLGTYIGVRDRSTGRLLAMAGERFRLGAGYIELSAICTHPEARRRGLAAALTRRLARHAFAKGAVPFLHVFPENAAAVALYERLGFRRRATLWVLWRRPAASLRHAR
jgi:ribosomal protein S18 acetylase RimI-like enzyme